MQLVRLIFILVFVAFGAGCGAKKEISDRDRTEAQMLVSEAQFAATLKDWARAEGLLARATELVPDTGDLWVNLGMARMRLGQRDGAKAAYRSALRAFEAAAKEAKAGDVGPWIQQVTTLALLGRADDARERMEEIQRRFPDSRVVQKFAADKALDRMLADAAFKEVAL